MKTIKEIRAWFLKKAQVEFRELEELIALGHQLGAGLHIGYIASMLAKSCIRGEEVEMINAMISIVRLSISDHVNGWECLMADCPVCNMPGTVEVFNFLTEDVYTVCTWCGETRHGDEVDIINPLGGPLLVDPFA